MISRKSLLKISDLTINDIQDIIELANKYLSKENVNNKILQNKTVINLFFEDSTRTLASFEIAGKSLGANVLTLSIKSSSISKGEDLKDMIETLNAMNCDFMVIRHKNSGIIDNLAQYVKCTIINAGDGKSEHPTQAITDYLVISHHKKQIKNLKIVICGDVLHSRVARSNIRLLKMLGAKIHLVGPPTLTFRHFPEVDSINYSLTKGIKDADVIMLLRLQRERMNNSYLLPSEKEYFHLYGLDCQKLSYANANAIVMHPGPVNKGVEIDYSIADNIILQQVEFGLAVRKAVLHYYSIQ